MMEPIRESMDDAYNVIEKWLTTEICSLSVCGTEQHEQEQRLLLADLIALALDAARAEGQREGRIEVREHNNHYHGGDPCKCPRYKPGTDGLAAALQDEGEQ